jgi:hypothetical protein
MPRCDVRQPSRAVVRALASEFLPWIEFGRKLDSHTHASDAFDAIEVNVAELLGQ